MQAIKQEYLDQLIHSIGEKCQHTKAHIDLHRSCFSNNRDSANFSQKLKELVFTLQVAQAEGSKFTDPGGNRYLDISMGFGVHLFGHRPAFIEAAMREQMEKGLALGPISPDAGVVAALIREATGHERSAFYNSGTEAVMVALRLARAATGKNKVVIFDGAYHGTFDPLLTRKWDPKSRQAITTVPGISPHLVADTYILEYGHPLSLEFIAQHGSELAAVLIEPVQSRHPERTSAEFLRALRQVTQEQDVALIFDEIITGFRMANGGIGELLSIQADLSTFGKVLGGGMPLGVVAGKAEFLDFVDGGPWKFGDHSQPEKPKTFVAGTFCHHPLTLASTRATLQYLLQAKGKIQQDLNATTQDFCESMNSWFQEEGYPVSLVHFGSLFRFVLKGWGRMLFYALLREGVYVWEGRNCFLSTAHTAEDLEFLRAKIQLCCEELAACKMMRQQANRHSQLPS